jgi:hypothetical protein
MKAISTLIISILNDFKQNKKNKPIFDWLLSAGNTKARGTNAFPVIGGGIAILVGVFGLTLSK